MWYTFRMFSWNKYQDKRICVAVSGGADSVALLHLLKTQKEEYGYSLCAAHCEHGIRGEESKEDMAFVRALCAAWKIPLYLFSDDCVQRAKREKVSLETAARDFRYECFSSLTKEGKTDFIALAHHQGDEAETVLFRLARGAAMGGMSAMKEENGVLLRPILTWKKSEILAYIEKNGLSFREDSTNFEPSATRNKLRLQILPALEEAVPGAAENIARFARLAAEDDELLYALSESLLSEDGEGFAVAFSDKKPLFTRACLTAIKRLGGTKDYTAAHLNGLFALQNAERGAALHLPSGIRAERGKSAVFFCLTTSEETFPLPSEKPFTVEGYDGGRYEVNVSFTPPTEDERAWKVLRIDGEKLPESAVFRFRKEGDEIKTFGGGTKSLKKLLNEREIPPKERSVLPIVGEREKTVYVVCGVEIASSVKVDEGTKAPLYIWIRKKEK